MRRVIFSAYRNSWSGPEVPVGEGAFVEISENAFIKLFSDEKMRKHLWISTSKGYLFFQPDELKSINYFRAYNCSSETGKSVAFWLDTGVTGFDHCITLMKELEFYPRMRYTTILKRYCIWA